MAALPDLDKVSKMNDREDLIILNITRNWLQNSNYSQRDFAVNMLAPKLKSQEPESLGDWVIGMIGINGKRIYKRKSAES